jgi:hypothetical protein
VPPSWTDRTFARRRNDWTRHMYTNKKTIANSPYEEALSELRAAVPSLQAIADRLCAGSGERVRRPAAQHRARRHPGGRSNHRNFRACAMVIGRALPLQGCDHVATHR